MRPERKKTKPSRYNSFVSGSQFDNTIDDPSDSKTTPVAGKQLAQSLPSLVSSSSYFREAGLKSAQSKADLEEGSEPEDIPGGLEQGHPQNLTTGDLARSRSKSYRRGLETSTPLQPERAPSFWDQPSKVFKP